MESPDERSIITYVSSLYNALPHSSSLSKVSFVRIVGVPCTSLYAHNFFVCKFLENFKIICSLFALLLTVIFIQNAKLGLYSHRAVVYSIIIFICLSAEIRFLRIYAF